MRSCRARPSREANTIDFRSLLATRVARHRDLSARIEAARDDELFDLVSRSERALPLPQSSEPVFVKLLPLTDLELRPEHRHSTANLFGLPGCYHYRIGSCGFGAWRELEAHQVASEWVLSGRSPHFPLLHGWRTLPIASPLHEDFRDMERWGNAPAIERRVEAASQATNSLALFLEHFPQTLGQRLRERLATGLGVATIVEETEAKLTDLLGFTRGQGLLHLDAHFENVLMNGSQLVLSDFGLAISREFQLEAAERAFFARHQSFDLCTALTSLVHALVVNSDPSREDWREPLRALLGGRESSLDAAPAEVRAYLEKRGPVALAAGDFYRALLADLATEYPDAAIQALLRR